MRASTISCERLWLNLPARQALRPGVCGYTNWHCPINALSLRESAGERGSNKKQLSDFFPLILPFSRSTLLRGHKGEGTRCVIAAIDFHVQPLTKACTNVFIHKLVDNLIGVYGTAVTNRETDAAGAGCVDWPSEANSSTRGRAGGKLAVMAAATPQRSGPRIRSARSVGTAWYPARTPR